ncbi:hypothetical protein NX059_011040 [Plenodomus lindquistii]|nr:hypothetical protein NX059_011040 [Plenodomus lindquistii]
MGKYYPERDEDRGRSSSRTSRLSHDASLADESVVAEENTAVDGLNPSEDVHGNSPSKEWTPGVLTHFPVLGLLSLAGVLASTIAAISILLLSNQQPLDTWGYGIAPSVYLSIISVLSNIMLSYALTEGVIITFWRTAMHGTSAFGFNSECDSSDSTNSSKVLFDPIFGTSTELIQISADGILATREAQPDAGIRLNITYTNRRIGPGGKWSDHQISHLCNFTGAIVEYKVEIFGDTIVLGSSRLDDVFVEKIATIPPNLSGYQNGIELDSDTGGFEYVTSYMFTSSVKGPVGTIYKGALANEMAIRDDGHSFECRDPLDTILDTMRELAFRVQAGKNSSLDNITNAVQQVEYRGTATRSIYVTDFRYMAIAASLSTLGLLAVGSTFYGWWELGRDFSLSPLDIAKAFDAPLLQDFDSSTRFSGSRDLGDLGSRRVRYGEELVTEAVETELMKGCICACNASTACYWS